jgi:hypothetical protein
MPPEIAGFMNKRLTEEPEELLRRTVSETLFAEKVEIEVAASWSQLLKQQLSFVKKIRAIYRHADSMLFEDTLVGCIHICPMECFECKRNVESCELAEEQPQVEREKIRVSKYQANRCAPSSYRECGSRQQRHDMICKSL